MTTPRYAGNATAGTEKSVVTLVEGMQVHHGPASRLIIDDKLLSTHVLFLGGIGSGKTNAMKQLIRQLRKQNAADDVFVIFDTKGDFQRDFYRPGDAVLCSQPDAEPGGVIWNLFRDLPEDPRRREEEAYEIASTIFSDELAQAGENVFFATAARDIFAGVVEALASGDPSPTSRRYSNAELRRTLESEAGRLHGLLAGQPSQAGTARYLEGGDQVESILAFLQLTLRKTFSGVFREPGDFSVRDFVRNGGGRALFLEYDVAVGSNLLPVYRTLMDLAIKEALGLGRRRLRENRRTPNIFFVVDEFALLPRLSHISDGINFGRELGLKFLVATQNVNQVLGGYPDGLGESILSGFGSLFAFRLLDEASRVVLRQRYGTNRKKISTTAMVRHEGVQETIVTGNVIEDWQMSGLAQGQCIAALPQEPPFYFEFPRLLALTYPWAKSRRSNMHGGFD